MEEESKVESKKEKNTSYDKRPLWQWLLVYLVVGGILYAMVYVSYARKNAVHNNNTTRESMQYIQPTDSTSDSEVAESAVVSNSLLITMTNDGKGDYLTDPDGMTVYTYDNDKLGESNCDSACLSNWPPYLAPSEHPTNLPPNVGIGQTTDGSIIYTWGGMPLYYYIGDKAPGDINGDGVGGVWHIVNP